MALFGYPVAQENDAERAVRAEPTGCRILRFWRHALHQRDVAREPVQGGVKELRHSNAFR